MFSATKNFPIPRQFRWDLLEVSGKSKILRKTNNISYPHTHTHKCIYQELRNNSFSKNVAFE